MLEQLRYRRLDRALRLAEKINAKDLFMVCMCVHACICVHVHVCVYMHVLCACVHVLYVCVHVHVCVHECIVCTVHPYTCTCISVDDIYCSSMPQTLAMWGPKLQYGEVVCGG